MARIRTIKPEFFTSLTIASLPVHTRLTFIGLWTHVDDEGRCVDDARLIKAALWPLDDRLSGDVEEDLKLLAESSLIIRYALPEDSRRTPGGLPGRSYLAVAGFREHQKISHPTPSKLPPPPAHDSGDTDLPREPLTGENTPLPESSRNPPGILPEDSSLKGTGNREQGTGKKNVVAAQRLTPPAAPAPERTSSSPVRGTRLPDDFAVTPEMAAWARENAPNVDERLATEMFRNYWAAETGRNATKRDWSRAWMNWILKDEITARRRPGPRPDQRAPAGPHVLGPGDVRCPEHRTWLINNCPQCRDGHGDPAWHTRQRAADSPPADPREREPRR